MIPREIIELYLKERDYQTTVFGDYQNKPTLSVASFLAFLKAYIDKAIAAYGDKWESELPPWLINCNEMELQEHAPVKVYEELIKIMALSGAALEVYTQIDVGKWRETGIKRKWTERKGED